MEFKVEDRVFELLEDYSVGIVAVKGIDNTSPRQEIVDLLNENIGLCEEYFEGIKVKEAEEVASFREAFRTLNMNPNKFMSSIEALLTRISKKKGFPSINPIVDLGNAISLKYHIPIGAHDMGTIGEALEVRFAREGDKFIAFGGEEVEYPEEDELVYVSGNEIRTRRWIWRQSDIGKIGPDTNTVFYPIDGFAGKNLDSLLKARDELAEKVEEIFGCQVVLGLVDRENPSFKITF